MAASTPEQQRIHKSNLMRICAKALEHAANVFLKPDDPVRQLVRSRIDQVLSGRFDANQVRQEQKRRRSKPLAYTAGNCIMTASEELVLLAGYGGHLSGSKLQNVLVECWNAALGDLGPQNAEMRWQDENIHPLIEEAFENYGQPINFDVIEEVRT